jgi:hypothetical protein
MHVQGKPTPRISRFLAASISANAILMEQGNTWNRKQKYFLWYGAMNGWDSSGWQDSYALQRSVMIPAQAHISAMRLSFRGGGVITTPSSVAFLYSSRDNYHLPVVGRCPINFFIKVLKST